MDRASHFSQGQKLLYNIYHKERIFSVETKMITYVCQSTNFCKPIDGSLARAEQLELDIHFFKLLHNYLLNFNF